jgi:glycine/D-amino acid oxidase-like deaminating enzyme
MRAASVVIIGAGVIGASMAYHLARRGWRDLDAGRNALRPSEFRERELKAVSEMLWTGSSLGAGRRDHRDLRLDSPRDG